MVNKARLLSVPVVISTLMVAILIVGITSQGVGAVFDPEMVERTKDQYPDTSKSSERTPSSNPTESTSNGSATNDASNSGGVTKTQFTRSTESPKTTDTSNKPNEPLNLTPYIAGGIVLVVIAAGAGLFIAKQRKK